jgi:hypothetical protein
MEDPSFLTQDDSSDNLFGGVNQQERPMFCELNQRSSKTECGNPQRLHAEPSITIEVKI